RSCCRDPRGHLTNQGKPSSEPGPNHPSRSTMTNTNPNREVATVAGGCFWCLQPIFQDLRGVEKVEVGYSGGHLANPSYEAVCTDTTGHAEAVQVTFDPQTIPLVDILRIFFSVHDPTTLNRQGADEGTQYRSAIFPHSAEQAKAAKQVIRAIEEAGIWLSARTATSDPMTCGRPCPKCGSTGIERVESARGRGGRLGVGHVRAGAFGVCRRFGACGCNNRGFAGFWRKGSGGRVPKGR